jgi:hypothetical protein
LKPSLYFANGLSYFSKRFYSAKALHKWFLKSAGETTSPFEYPASLAECEGHLIFLPQSAEEALPYFPLIRRIVEKDSEKMLLVGNENLKDLVHGAGFATVPRYYSTLGCRYGEPEFETLKNDIQQRSFSVCLYLEPEPFYQRLFLAKVSNAIYRIGFMCESLYPFLNVSLHASAENAHAKASVLEMQYGKGPA